MLVPIGHEKGTVLRWPWVTLTVIGLCLVVFLATLSGADARRQEVERRFGEVVDYFIDHPYLELPSELASVGRWFSSPEGRRPLPRQRAEEQRELDQRIAAWRAARRAQPLFAWGFVSAEFSWTSILTAMFVHAGWLHLIGNLLILYLAGPPVEDVWGRQLFAVFYLLSGIVATLVFAVRFPDLTLPLVGASGAVAGVMGAFLVRYWRVQIHFFYFVWFFRIFTGTFKAPAWLMLPLWFASELFSAYVTDRLFPEGGGGVAHWAHVGGFVFGVGAAWAVQQFDIENKYLKPKIHGAIGLAENKVVDEAHALRQEGKHAEAMSLLSKELRRRPGNREAAILLWDTAVMQGRPGLAVAPMMRLIWEEVREGDEEMALSHWDEVQLHCPETLPDVRLRVRLAEMLVADDRRRDARPLVAASLEQAGDLPVPIAVRLARLAVALDPESGLPMARQLLARKELTLELRDEVEALVRETQPAPASEGTAAQEVGGADFEVLSGVPEGFESERLLLKVDGKGAVALPYERIVGIGVARIEESGYQPYLLLDLFLDPVTRDASRLRVVRTLTSLFDPLTVMTFERDSEVAFRALVQRLIEKTRQRLYPVHPLPEPEATPTFSSEAEYEAAVRRSVAASGL